MLPMEKNIVQTNKGGISTLSISIRADFFRDLKETKELLVLAVKGEVNPPVGIPDKVVPLLEEFHEVIPEDLPRRFTTNEEYSTPH